jgi:hypothetical protein
VAVLDHAPVDVGNDQVAPFAIEGPVAAGKFAALFVTEIGAYPPADVNSEPPAVGSPEYRWA